MSVASVFQMKRTEVVAMLGEMGFQTADKWDDVRLMKKLRALPKLIAEDTEVPEPQTPEYRSLLASILKAKENEVDLELEPVHLNNGAVPNGTAHKKGDSKMTTATVEKKGKKEKKEKKEKAAVDKFGSRIGSNNAKFNERLSTKTKSMAQLVKEADLGERTFYNHMNKLLADFPDKVGKSEEGYFLKK